MSICGDAISRKISVEFQGSYAAEVLESTAKRVEFLWFIVAKALIPLATYSEFYGHSPTKVVESLVESIEFSSIAVDTIVHLIQMENRINISD